MRKTSKARKLPTTAEFEKVNLDIPQWMVEGLDHAAEQIRTTGQ